MPESQHVRIENWLPAQVANGSHGHWSTRRKAHNEARDTTYGYAKHAGWRRIACRGRLTVVLVFGTHRRRDTDNLYARVKGLVDGLKPFLIDDSTDWLELIVRAEVRKGEKAVEITLESLP